MEKVRDQIQTTTQFEESRDMHTRILIFNFPPADHLSLSVEVLMDVYGKQVFELV